jgi:beta-glucanase (GH16 family)
MKPRLCIVIIALLCLSSFLLGAVQAQNLARQATATGSSILFPGMPVTNANDGNIATRWCIANNDTAPWLQLQWTTGLTIREVVMKNYSASNNTGPFSISIRKDGIWQQIGQITTPYNGVTGSVVTGVADFPAVTTTRVRIDGIVSPWEVEVYANPPQNLASLANATASTAWPGYPATNVNDGNASTRWSMASGDHAPWLALQWTAAQTINRVVIESYSGPGTPVPLGVSVWQSGAWVRVGQIMTAYNGVTGSVVTGACNFPAVATTGVRIDGAVSPWEVQVYQSPNAVTTPAWKLVWSDEFNTPGTSLPDSTKWDYEYGFVRNNELQFYMRSDIDNTYVANGVLTIEGRKEVVSNPNYNPNAPDMNKNQYAQYSSASMITKGKASWTYGRIELRAKLPQGSGVWPAFWMMGTNIDSVGWPTCGETDIMEYFGWDAYTTTSNPHYRKNGVPADFQAKWTSTQLWDDFHIYAMEWYPDRMDFYFDSQLLESIPLVGLDDVDAFQKPMYILLNFALGSYGGTLNDSILPQRLVADYVRVYQLDTGTTAVDTVSAAKSMGNNSSVQIGSPTKPVVVSVAPGVLSDRFYVEQPDRSSGIAVQLDPGSNPAIAAGDRVWVSGLLTAAGGERVIQHAIPLVQFHDSPPGPLLFDNCWLGGSSLNSFTSGIEGAAGLNNLGMLIKTCGRLGNTDPNGAYFYIDDGSNLSDGTMTGACENLGVRVSGDGRSYTPGSYMAVTGISSCFVDENGKSRRFVRALSVQPL